MTGNPSASQALFRCATECALLRRNRHCRNNFGSQVCNSCKWYIYRYINADPRHVELYMLEAEFRAIEIKAARDRIKATGGGHRFVFSVLISICLFFAWTCYKHEQSRDLAVYNTGSQPKNTAISTSPVSVYSDIEATLKLVARDLGKKTDVNGDGLTNCIDAAVLFYKYYPNKDKVCIELNYNPATGMNHLFNCVLVDGVWRAVEPQAYNKSHYWMRDVWGSKYDNTKNEDVTADYKKFAK